MGGRHSYDLCKKAGPVCLKLWTMETGSTFQSTVNERCKKRNSEANMSKTNTDNYLSHKRRWTQLLQVYGFNNFFINPSRVCQQRRGEFKSDCSEKDVPTINPIESFKNMSNYQDNEFHMVQDTF